MDSRLIRQGEVIRRRRECLHCAYRFSTYEEVVKTALRVIKRDESHEEFNRRKLQSGLELACEKRPVTIQQIEKLVEEVIGELEQEYEREVPSTALGEKVMAKLQALDEVAYVRFASVYRRFKDVSQFVSHIQALSEQ